MTETLLKRTKNRSHLSIHLTNLDNGRCEIVVWVTLVYPVFPFSIFLARYVMLCYVMLCYVMLCYVMLRAVKTQSNQPTDQLT